MLSDHLWPVHVDSWQTFASKTVGEGTPAVFVSAPGSFTQQTVYLFVYFELKKICKLINRHMQRIADLDRFSDLWYVMSIDHFAYALRHPSDRHSKLRVRSVYFPDCISQFNIFHIFSFLLCHLFGLLNDILFKFFCQPFCLLFLYKIVVAFLFTLLYYVDKMVIYMTFANNLKRLRTEANLTQEELAAMIGTSKQAISRYERRERNAVCPPESPSKRNSRSALE